MISPCASIEASIFWAFGKTTRRQMTMTTWIIFLVALVIAYVTLTYPGRYRPDFEIIQTDVSRLKPSMLLEKYPIIIDDQLVDPRALLRTTFKYQYLWGDPTGDTVPEHVQQRPLAKYTVLYNASDAKQNVDITHPKYGGITRSADAPMTRVLLGPLQTIVLPPRWAYQLGAPMTRIELWDVPHWIRSMI
jgi:hypothetical protein